MAAISMLAAAILLPGCSGGDKPEVKVRDRKEVTKQVERASSEILKLISIEGKVTEPGAMTVPCSEYSDEDEVYRARHSWSLYDVPVGDLTKAMDRLRGQLPKQGWKIVKDGPDQSRAKTPQIVADSTDGKHSADIRLLDESKKGNKPSLIEVTVVSPCYRDD